MGSPLTYHNLKRKFNSYGITVEKISGTHIWLTGKIDGIECNYTLNTKHKRIDPVLVKKARRAFHLTKEFGVDDDEFNAR